MSYSEDTPLERVHFMYERINGNIYRKKVAQSINEMTSRCIELLK